MNVALVVFSQTGNTRKVAETMAEEFEENGHTARIIPLEKATDRDITSCDLLGTGSPCFASQAPTPIKRFLRGLPYLDGRPVFVFATSGGGPGKVLYDQTRILHEKGADVLGGFLSRGEIFYPLPCILGRFPGRPDEQDLSRARSFTSSLAEHVSAGRKGPLPESRPDALKQGWGFYDVTGMLLPDAILRHSLPTPKLNRMACDQCKRCAKECPMGNITLKPYPELGKDCIRCLRCMNCCPRKAINADMRLSDALVSFSYCVTFERWFGDLERGEPAY